MGREFVSGRTGSAFRCAGRTHHRCSGAARYCCAQSLCHGTLAGRAECVCAPGSACVMGAVGIACACDAVTHEVHSTTRITSGPSPHRPGGLDTGSSASLTAVWGRPPGCAGVPTTAGPRSYPRCRNSPSAALLVVSVRRGSVGGPRSYYRAAFGPGRIQCQPAGSVMIFLRKACRISVGA